ncbi:MAG: gliding motility-associated C-terminal domain-containing protein [Bacteroidota bacterium]|nr:gliding motility-associated C-terminal domain-containing protein [Bacteroidota bacterium]
MKKILSITIVLFLIFSTSIKAQQKVVNPYQLIEEKLMREKRSSPVGSQTNHFGGIVREASHAPTGVFTNSLSQEELKNQCSFFKGDTLNGFVFEKVAKEIEGLKLLGEFKAAMFQKQLAFVKNKYNIVDKITPSTIPFVDVTAKSSSQTSSMPSTCNNVDFEDGNLGTWTVTSGYNTNSNSFLTIAGAGFTNTNQSTASCFDVNLITAAYGNDPIGFPGLDPNGGTASVRLGGPNINLSDGYIISNCPGSYWWNLNYSNGEKIEKIVNVSAANALLTYDYAVVLNDAGASHLNGEQPYFHVYVTDLAGTVLSSCTQYYVQAGGGSPPPGFVYSGFVNGGDNSLIYYRNWTSNSINLTPYIGSNVKISFVSAGCKFGAHFAYAYVDAICGPLQINSSSNNPCVGSSPVLTAPAVQGGSYLWSGTGVNGLTTQNVNVTTSGTYTCVITPPQGPACSYTLTRSVTFVTLPTANAGTTPTITCASPNVSLSGSGGGNYTWSGPGIVSGGTSANPSVNVAGTYSLVVTDGFGCNSPAATVAVASNTVKPAPNTITSSAITCSSPNSNAAITATTGMNYSWSGPGIVSGGTSSSALVNVSGNYIVTVTNPVNGCSNTATVNVPLNTTAPGPNTIASSSITCSSPNSNAAITATAGMTYNWSGPGIVSGGTSASAVVNVSGSYVVTVTAANGCTATASVSVPLNNTLPLPNTLSSASITCSSPNSSAAITATAGMNYSWSGPGIVSGGTSSSANVNVSGNYIVTVTNPLNGCSNTATVNVPLNTTAPSPATLTASPITCSSANSNAAITPTLGMTYSWSGPGIVSGGATASANVNVSGNYIVTVTNSSNGCIGTGTVNVPLSTGVPGPTTLTPNAITCGTPNVNAAITATAGMNYSWTGPGIVSGATTNSPVVNVSGNYVVTVLNTINSCTAAVTINVPINNTVTVAPSTSGNVTCTNPLITLSTTNLAGQNYTWTAPSGAAITTGANAATATGSNVGTYTVTVFNTTNGCTQVGTIAANVNTTVPTATASISGVITCTSTALNLSVNPAGLNYNWTASGGGLVTGSNTLQATTGSGNGTYSVLVTNPANGCAVTKTIVPTVNTTTIAASINIPNSLMCNTTTVSLTGNPSAGVSYIWTAPSPTNIVTGNTTQTIGVNAPGNYTLTLTNNANGCPSTPTVVNVTQTLTQPTLSAISQTAASGCGTASLVTLSGLATPAGSTYTWASSGGFSSGVNSSTVLVNGSNTYTLTSSHPVTGCPASMVFTVVPSINQPTLTSNNATGTITCLNLTQSTTVTSNPSTGITYAWTGPGIVGSSTGASVTGSLAGTYNLLVTNTGNNCNNTISFVIGTNNAPVTPTASSSNTITCVTSSSITANVTGTGPFTYLWNGPSSFATSSQSFVTSTQGVYNVTVTNTSSGCTGTTNINAAGNFTAPSTPVIAANNITLTCASGNATVITASSTGATSYSWTAPSTGAITSGSNAATASVTGTGIFTVVAIGGNGCNTAFFPVTATVSPAAGAPATSLSTNSLNITCSVTNPSATANTTVTGVTYSWSPSTGIAGSNTNATVTFTQSGTYSVIVTNTANSCASSGAGLIVTVTNNNAQPTASLASTPTINCTNTVVAISPIFTPSTGLVYSWTGANIIGTTTNSSVQTNSNTPLTVTYTNTSNGCVNSLTVAAIGNNVVPTLSLSSTNSATNLSCANPTLTYSAASTPTSGVTYLWSNGATTPSVNILIAGTYSVVATNTVSGCQTIENFIVSGGTSVPSFTTASNAVIPCGSSTTNLSATSSNTNVTYIWGGPGILNGANTANPIIGNAGTYTLLVTDNTSSCSVTQTVSVSNSSVVAQFTANPLAGPAPLNVDFTNQSSGAINYSWDFGNGTSTQTNPSNTYPVSGTFTVLLTASNGACTSTASIIIEVKEGLGTIPEVYTPNGDGHNEVFEIKGLDSYPNNSLQVFNRWGNAVYTAKPYKNDWNGIPNVSGKTGGDKLPTGTYYYILELGDDAKTIFRGYVQLQY